MIRDQSIRIPIQDKNRDLISVYSEFPPIFKNTLIELDDTGEMMHKICPCTNRKTGVRHSLVSGLFGENIVILADMIEEYLRIDISTYNTTHLRKLTIN